MALPKQVDPPIVTQRIQGLARQLVELQADLDREIHMRRKVLGWRLKGGLAEFEPQLAICLLRCT